METKECNTCHKSFPITNKFFTIDRRNSKWVNNKCKECYRKKSRDKYKENPEISKVYYESNKEHILEYHRDYYQSNTELCKENGRQNYQNNKESYYARSVQWKAANREKVNEGSRERYQRVKEHHAEITKRWKLEHRDLVNVHWQNRFAKKKKLEYTFTQGEWQEAKEYFGNKCAYCGKESKLTQDHFIPVDKDGAYAKHNIIPACSYCNCSKASKLFSEWYPKYKDYSEYREHQILNFINKTNALSVYP